MKVEAFKFYEDLMAVVCDLCHRPYVETDQEVLDAFCEESCQVNKILRSYLHLDTETEAQRGE